MVNHDLCNGDRLCLGKSLASTGLFSFGFLRGCPSTLTASGSLLDTYVVPLNG